MSNKPKTQTTKRKKQRKGKKALSIIVAGLIFILLAWGDGGDGKTKRERRCELGLESENCEQFSPLPPDLPDDYTPAPTADYGVWK